MRARAAAIALACLSTFSFASCAPAPEPAVEEPAVEEPAVEESVAEVGREDVDKQPAIAAPAEAHAPAPLTPAQQRVPQDLRQKVASLMVVGVANYDQARFALDQGVGGLIIPSWADPALLTEAGRDINALRAQYPRCLLYTSPSPRDRG